jgi:hypothetical protein
MEKDLRHDDCLLCAESIPHRHGDSERKIRYEHSEEFQERCCGGPGLLCEVCLENYYYHHGLPEPYDGPKLIGLHKAMSLEGRDTEKG